MKLTLRIEKSPSIDRKIVEKMVRDEIYLKVMTFDDFVEMIIKIIKKTGVHIKDKH